MSNNTKAVVEDLWNIDKKNHSDLKKSYCISDVEAFKTGRYGVNFISNFIEISQVLKYLL
jgi:hypothetical protein